MNNTDIRYTTYNTKV